VGEGAICGLIQSYCVGYRIDGFNPNTQNVCLWVLQGKGGRELYTVYLRIRKRGGVSKSIVGDAWLQPRM
jgi:hypothetical protein